MARPKKKTYLDMFLDNAENKKKKVKEDARYFNEPEELAILKFNDENTTYKEKTEIFDKVIRIAFQKTAEGVMKMPNFRKLPKSMDRDMLIEDTYYRLVEKIGKFTPNLIGKNGQPVKAYSYFSTIAKNFILEKKKRHEKILENRADVESSIDLSILSEDTLKMMSNYDKMDVQLEDYEVTFNNTRAIIISAIEETIRGEEAKNKKDENMIRIGYYLVYILKKWNSIEFMKKNEFMRILTLYTGLKQQQVSLQFKKYKVAVFKKLRPNGVSKISSKKVKEIDELFDDDLEDTNEDDILIDDTIEQVEAVAKPVRFKYGIRSMEEFETLQELELNDVLKAAITDKKPKVNE